MLKRIAVYVDEDTHEDLFDLAKQTGRSVSELVRCAVVAVYEDDLDVITAERGLNEYLTDPDSYISWDELKGTSANDERNIRAKAGRDDHQTRNRSAG